MSATTKIHQRPLGRLRDGLLDRSVGLRKLRLNGAQGKESILTFYVEQFCRQLIAEAPDAIIYADADGLICFWNTGAERIFGFSKLDALGNTLDIIIPERLRRRHWDGYARTIRTGVTHYGASDVLAVPALRKDGLRISVEFTILPITGQDGQVIGIGAILRDVSARFNEMRELREKLSAAQPVRSSP